MQHIEESCNLAKMVNKIFNELDMHRLVVYPKSFEHAREEEPHVFRSFYMSVLWQEYLSGIVPELQSWQKLLEAYFSEYNGSWRYYAASYRLDCIKEGFGDEEDYDENGEVIMEGITDEHLSSYSILNRLYDDSWTNVFTQTRPEDLEEMYVAIMGSRKVSFSEVFRKLGFEILLYTIKDGERKPMKREEEELMKASGQMDAATLILGLNAVCRNIMLMCQDIQKLKADQDNREQLQDILRKTKKLLDLNIEDLVTSEDHKVFERVFLNN